MIVWNIMEGFWTTVVSWADGHPVLALLLILMAIDVTMGLLRAWQDKKLNSDISGRGMRRKAVMIILVMLGHALDRFGGPTIGIETSAVGNVIAGGFVVSECLSVFENAALLGVPVPAFLRKAFEQLASHTAKAENKVQRRDVVDRTLDRIEDGKIE